MIYHIGAKLYNDIRPLAFQNLKYEVNDDVEVDYDRTVFAFPSIVTKDDILLLRNAGFKPWLVSDILYIYTIDLQKEIGKVDKIHIESTPEQEIYDDELWDKFIKNEMVQHGNFKLAKARYIEQRDRFLTNVNFTGVGYLKYSKTHSFDMTKYFKHNVKVGKKEQYASMIPHLGVVVNEPLSYIKVDKLIFKK